MYLVACLTMLLKNSGGKQVGSLLCHFCIVCKIFNYFFMVVLIPTGTITVRVICGHGC